MKKLHLYIISFLVLFVFGCSNSITTPEPPVKAPIRNIEIKSESPAMDVGNKITLSVATEDNSELEALTWEYDKTYLYKITNTESSITLEILKPGSTLISVTESNTWKKASFEINIKETPLPTPADFDPYNKQPVGFDSNPLYGENHIHLLNIIKNYGSNGGMLRDKPKPDLDFDFTEQKIIFSPDDDTQTISLSLVDINTKEITPDTDIQWFVVQNYPSDAIYTAQESSNPYCPVTITSGQTSGTVTLQSKKPSFYNDPKSRTNGDIIAVIDNRYIHRKPFYVLNEKEEGKQTVVTKVNEIVDEMISPMWQFSDLQKALFIQETVCKHLTYDMDYVNRATDENMFIHGLAVCEGYARMYSRLAKELGMLVRVDIETKIAQHAWNRIWIDDGFYYIDTTWDDLNENEYLLDYFLMPVDTFETRHPRTLSAYKDGNFGTKHVSTAISGNEQLYNSMKAEGMPVIEPSRVSRKPDLSKIDFIGTEYNSGYITTYDTDLEYTTGYDGLWHQIEPGIRNIVSNINHRNESYYDPLGSQPFFILIRRKEPGKESSEYVKLNITDKYSGPTWIETSEDGTVYNINTKMEYSTDNSNFIPVTSNEMKLSPGIYYFRLKGSKNNLPSEAVTVSVL